MLEKLAIVGLTEKQKEMINKSFKKSKNPYPLESILEKPQQPIVDNGEKIKPEEFYKKNWGDASNISKEEVIKLLNNFARILEMERKRNKIIEIMKNENTKKRIKIWSKKPNILFGIKAMVKKQT